MKTTVKVYLKGAKGLDSFTTSINLSREEATNYYLDKVWNVGSGEHDYFAKCYKVEVLTPITELETYARDDKFLYMLLSRLKMDCNYYLGYGNRNKDILWSDNEAAHINEMKQIHNYLNPKPEWLTIEQIDEFEKQMIIK